MNSSKHNRKVMIISFISGLFFSAGLLISGMANPKKVLSFLDLAGMWDPSLIFVMLGAIGISLPAFIWIKSQQKSLLDEPIQLPQNSSIDKPLIIGSALFGAGWGVAGICPGPAIVLLGALSMKGIFFVGFMLLGMWVQARIYTNKS